MHVGRHTFTVLAIVASVALMSPAAAPAHEGWQATVVPTAKAGDTCAKKGQVQGNLTCKKVGGEAEVGQGFHHHYYLDQY